MYFLKIPTNSIPLSLTIMYFLNIPTIYLLNIPTKSQKYIRDLLVMYWKIMVGIYRPGGYVRIAYWHCKEKTWGVCTDTPKTLFNSIKILCYITFFNYRLFKNFYKLLNKYIKITSVRSKCMKQ